MSTPDKQIADILAKYGEPFEGSVWRVQGNAVILHKALERIAARARISFDDPKVIRAERDEAVVLVRGTLKHLPDELRDSFNAKYDDPMLQAVHERDKWSLYETVSAWSFGEALINVNYRVSGRQAAYVYAMAEKRAVDRVILKLIGLHGLLYSEEEADDFKAGRPTPVEESPHGHSAVHAAAAKGKNQVAQGVSTIRGEPVTDENVPFGPTDQEAVTYIKHSIDRHVTVEGVTDYMLQAETQQQLNELPQELRDEVRAHAKARLMALGYQGKRAS
jgi:hypothetical protein